MMTISGLGAGYDPVDVLHAVDITAAAGELTVILGANGSGKSTLFRAVSGVIRARAGTVEFDGADVTRASTAAIVRRGLAHCPEGRPGDGARGSPSPAPWLRGCGRRVERSVCQGFPVGECGEG